MCDQVEADKAKKVYSPMDGYDLYTPFVDLARCFRRPLLSQQTWLAVHDRLRSLSEDQLRVLRDWLAEFTPGIREWIWSYDHDTREEYHAKGFDGYPTCEDDREYDFASELLGLTNLLLAGNPLPEPPPDEDDIL
jgi:hypothetical protein